MLLRIYLEAISLTQSKKFVVDLGVQKQHRIVGETYVSPVVQPCSYVIFYLLNLI